MSEVISELNACGVLEPVSAGSSATVAEPTDPEYQKFLYGLEVEGEETQYVTKDQVATEEQPAPKAEVDSKKETLPSGFLDETITGGAVAAAKSGGGISKKVMAIAVGCVAALVLAAGIYIQVRTKVGTIIVEIDQPELAGASVTVDGKKKITIKTGDSRASPVFRWS